METVSTPPVQFHQEQYGILRDAHVSVHRASSMLEMGYVNMIAEAFLVPHGMNRANSVYVHRNMYRMQTILPVCHMKR